MKRYRIRIKPRAVLFALFLVLSVFIYRFIDQELKLRKQLERIDTMNATLEQKRTVNEKLEKEIEFYQSDAYQAELREREMSILSDDVIILKEQEGEAQPDKK